MEYQQYDKAESILLRGAKKGNAIALRYLVELYYTESWTGADIEKAEYWRRDGKNKFYSWYNGYGSHKVWGIGQVASHMHGAVVQCGGQAIPVLAIYDNHADMNPPNHIQTTSYAKAHNLELLARLMSEGKTCKLD